VYHASLWPLALSFFDDCVIVGSAEWPWNLPPEATARPTINQPEAGDPVAPWAGYDALRLVPPIKVKKMSEWVCPQHGLLCSPGICKERARLERDEQMRIEREKWEEQKIQHEARRAKKEEREGRREKEAEAMGIGEQQRPPHLRGGSNRSGTDTSTSRDEGNFLISHRYSHTQLYLALLLASQQTPMPLPRLNKKTGRFPGRPEKARTRNRS
jgi:hypothetical protein